jgi:predicted HTH transcriptional regulator
MNSLLCRDLLLSCSQPTQSKSYFDDRIEIENPGDLIPGLIEQWGSGIPVILDEAASQHLPPPLIEEVGLRFRVTLPLDQASSPAQGQSQGQSRWLRADSLRW